MKEKLDRLAQLAIVLNNERNSLNEQILKFEKTISNLNLGIRCVVNLNKDKINLPRINFGYFKYDEKWGLYIEDEVNTWQLNSAPSHFRIDAVKYFEELLDQLLNASKKHMEAIIKATELAAEINDKLKG